MIILSIHCIIFAMWASEIFQNCIGSTWPAECLIFDGMWDKLDTSWPGEVMYAYQWGERSVLLVFSRSLPGYSAVSHDVLLYYSLPALCSQSSGPWVTERTDLFDHFQSALFWIDQILVTPLETQIESLIFEVCLNFYLLLSKQMDKQQDNYSAPGSSLVGETLSFVFVGCGYSIKVVWQYSRCWYKNKTVLTAGELQLGNGGT